ncbi:MAG TPA: hypothetical protein VMY77_15040 [Chitinophagaceae bacterium]|nr:hypothetical protein [Chitinophagaceae bacterium]
MEDKKDINPEKFSDDPEENLRIENEILKLKLQAEKGAVIGRSDNLPPDIEHSFLQNVQQFENAWKDVKQVKVYELLGKPDYKKESELSEIEIKTELNKLFDFLKKYNISLSVLGDYDSRIIYKFITEELFEHETDDIQLPGMTKNFIYEDFHPNHKMDIHEKAMEFLGDWFEQKFSEYSWELNDPFILSDGSIMPKAEVLKKISYVFNSYSSFTNAKYAIGDISFQWDDTQVSGMGHAEGMVQYDAKLENGEFVHFDGPFKLYMSNEGTWWSVFYFVFPGFTW